MTGLRQGLRQVRQEDKAVCAAADQKLCGDVPDMPSPGWEAEPQPCLGAALAAITARAAFAFAEVFAIVVSGDMAVLRAAFIAAQVHLHLMDGTVAFRRIRRRGLGRW